MTHFIVFPASGHTLGIFWVCSFVLSSKWSVLWGPSSMSSYGSASHVPRDPSSLRKARCPALCVLPTLPPRPAMPRVVLIAKVWEHFVLWQYIIFTVNVCLVNILQLCYQSFFWWITSFPPISCSSVLTWNIFWGWPRAMHHLWVRPVPGWVLFTLLCQLSPQHHHLAPRHLGHWWVSPWVSPIGIFMLDVNDSPHEQEVSPIQFEMLMKFKITSMYTV